MAREPLFVLLVRIQIIEDDLEPGLGIGRNNLVHEGQELLAAPALLVRARDLASVRQLQIALRALQRLDRRFLVDTYDDGIVRRRHVEADHIGSLAGELRIVALAPALATAEIDLVFAQGTPDVLYVDVAQGLRDQRSVPPGKAFGWWPSEHRPYALVGGFAVDRRRAGAWQILQPVEPFAGKAPPPQADGGGSRIQLTGNLARHRSVGCLQHDPYPQQLSLLCGGRAEPRFQHRALFRLQPNLDRIRYHRALETRYRT